jgi:hypothetical protein
MQSETARQPLPPARLDPYDAATAVLLLGIAILIPLTVRDYGISNDEHLQHRYGELIVAYYASGFRDRALFAFENLYLYGGLFDVLAVLAARALPFDPYLIRHMLCAVVGFGGVVATWATARTVAGPRAGLIAAAVLAVTGVWYGGMFNHTKDVTFAAAMMGATYVLVRASRDLPQPRKRDVLLFGLLLGAALGIRVMGLLLGVYLALAVLLALPTPKDIRGSLLFTGRCVLAFLPAIVLGYLIMIAAWPWAALDPLNPLRAISAFADFHYKIRDLLAGRVYEMADMPRWYLPAYVSIKLPLTMLAGAALALVFAAAPRLADRQLSPRARREIALLSFAVLFPIACQVIGRGPIFSGMRHFIFIVPPLAALAGIGCHLLIAALDRWLRPAAMAAAAGIGAMLLWNAGTLMRLHPHEYLFYNALVGGLAGADGRYATDYWVNTMPEAVAALEAFVARAEQGGRKSSYNVAICAERLQFENVAGPRFRFTDDWDIAHFFISPTHMNCDNMMAGQVVATVERLGVVLAVVKDRRAIVAAAKKAAP